MKAGILSILAVLMATFTGTAEARSGVPLVQLENNAIVRPEGKELTMAAVEQAIREAAAAQGYPWTVAVNSPGNLRLTTIVRNKHTVIVDVIFDTKSYSIRYVSSANMNYEAGAGGGTIHHNYNAWVEQLKKGIDAALLKSS